MTQYILVKSSRRCDVLKPIADLKEPFYERVVEKIFPSAVYGDFSLVDADGDDIDTLFTEAQKAIGNNQEFENTRLNKVISRILEVSDEIVFWYGSDFDDLDSVAEESVLRDSLKQALETSSCEAYLHYISHQNKN